MDFDSFLTSPRWEILQILAKAPSSPIEISEKLNTTVSYVSQQLKLLDAAGLVLKQKTGASEKGKPRTLFRISEELVYLTFLTKKNSGKKLIHLTPHHKSILNIWMLEDSSLHYFIEKLFWKLKEDLKEIQGIFIKTNGFSPKLLIVSDSKKLKLKIESFVKTFERKVDFSFISKSQFDKLSLENFVSLYEANDSIIQLKGGII